MESLEELEKEVDLLQEKFGTFKVNIVYSGESEGVWFTPYSKEDLEKYKSTDTVGTFKGRLLNQPLIPQFCWGGLFIAQVHGENRPEILFEEQPEEVRRDNNKIRKLRKENDGKRS